MIKSPVREMIGKYFEYLTDKIENYLDGCKFKTIVAKINETSLKRCEAQYLYNLHL